MTIQRKNKQIKKDKRTKIRNVKTIFITFFKSLKSPVQGQLEARILCNIFCHFYFLEKNKSFEVFAIRKREKMNLRISLETVIVHFDLKFILIIDTLGDSFDGVAHHQNKKYYYVYQIGVLS